MAKPRVFVSSTCYDLGQLRTELRPFISQHGFEPVMSEYSDVLFDPRHHTHDSCLRSVTECDLAIVIIGSRFGGTAVPSARVEIDFKLLETLSEKPEILLDKEKLSVTQLEILRAVEWGIPLFTFVEERVLHDHLVYERNKDKDEVIGKITFPSIQKQETARYIFEFLNFVRGLNSNNGIESFTQLEDIRSHLRSQWGQFFQRLLVEHRTREKETRQYRDFSEAIQDLKAAVLGSISQPDLREIAANAVKHRQLVEFLAAFDGIDHKALLLSHASFDAIMRSAGVMRAVEIRSGVVRRETLLEKTDGTFYRLRISSINRIIESWRAFIELPMNVRTAIVEALLPQSARQFIFLLTDYPSTPLEEYLKSRFKKEGSPEADDSPELGAVIQEIPFLPPVEGE